MFFEKSQGKCQKMLDIRKEKTDIVIMKLKLTMRIKSNKKPLCAGNCIVSASKVQRGFILRKGLKDEN